MQVTGKVPSFAVDKCSGFNLFLSKDCLDAEIISSKSDSMNVVLPPAKDGDDVVCCWLFCFFVFFCLFFLDIL